MHMCVYIMTCISKILIKNISGVKSSYLWVGRVKVGWAFSVFFFFAYLYFPQSFAPQLKKESTKRYFEYLG